MPLSLIRYDALTFEWIYSTVWYSGGVGVVVNPCVDGLVDGMSFYLQDLTQSWLNGVLRRAAAGTVTARDTRMEVYLHPS